MLRRREFLAGAGVVVAEVATTSLALANKFKIDPSVHLAAAAESSSRKIPMRGVMVDAGRVPETMAYYKRVIEFCSDWGLNTLHFRLTDDQGSAMRFHFRPRSCEPRKCIYCRRIEELGGLWPKPRCRAYS